MAEVMDRELGWEDEIVNDGPSYELFPECDCNFKVVGFKRERHNGSAKLPACSKAALTIEIESDDGTLHSRVNHNLFLHTKTEGLLCSFFIRIGQKKHGEPLRMDWSKVYNENTGEGASGRCHVIVNHYTNDKGEERTNNQISRFLEPVEPAKKAFTPGSF